MNIAGNCGVVVPTYNRVSNVIRISDIWHDMLFVVHGDDGTTKYLDYVGKDYTTKPNPTSPGGVFNSALDAALEKGWDYFKILCDDDYLLRGWDTLWGKSGTLLTTQQLYVGPVEGVVGPKFIRKEKLNRIKDVQIKGVVEDGNSMGCPSAWYIPREIGLKHRFDETLKFRSDADYLASVYMDDGIDFFGYPYVVIITDKESGTLEEGAKQRKEHDVKVMKERYKEII